MSDDKPHPVNSTPERPVSPWLDGGHPFDVYVGPPPTSEVLNAWLHLVLSGVRKKVDSSARGEPDVDIESVDLEGEYPDIAVVILFRDARRPGCRFGYRWPFVGEIAAAGYPYNPDTEIWANFDEARILRLPEDCDPNEITWLDEPDD